MNPMLSSLPSALSIPTFAEMRERTQRLRARNDITVYQVGEDRDGEPIEMIALGDGMTHVLVIGAPHPNEPIGCIGIEWLIERFASDAELLRETGCRWYFIKAIEPYALKQNEEWFGQPDVARYLQHYYRPMSGAQAEYSFPPPSTESSGAWQASPENEAYQEALKTARPDLLVSLHNAESSGAFYFISRDDPALAAQLSTQACAHGLPLNLLGEEAPDVREAPLAPGVFLLVKEASPPDEAREQPGLSVTAWLAGQAAPAPLFLVPEVPLFLDRHQGNAFASMDACLDSVREMAWPAKLETLLAERLGSLEVDATPIEQLYLHAIREAVPLSVKLVDALPALKTQAEPGDFEAQVRAQVLITLRPMALARRLAALRAARTELGELGARSARALEQACARDLSMALESPLLRDAFQRVPLRAAVATQLDAVLSAAQAVSGQRSATAQP